MFENSVEDFGQQGRQVNIFFAGVWQWGPKSIVVTGILGSVLVWRGQMVMLMKDISEFEGSQRK